MSRPHLTRPPLKILLDSGAFTVWRSGGYIDLWEYVDFVTDNELALNSYINLDVMPGALGRVPTPTELEESARAGYENLLIMESAGLHCMPVYHAGEDLRWLDKYISKGYTYIGISPSSIRSSRGRVAFLDRVYDHIANSAGQPVVATHLLGLTSLPLMYRYPWKTCDSTSWMLIGAFGNILLPKMNDGVPDYSVSPNMVAMSEKSGSIKGGKHFLNMKGHEKKAIVDFIESNGFTVTGMETHYRDRMKLITRVLLNVQATLRKKNMTFQKQGFIHTSSYRNEPGFVIKDRSIIFAFPAQDSFNSILNGEGVVNRLVSYEFLKQRNLSELHTYKKTWEFLPTGV